MGPRAILLIALVVAAVVATPAAPTTVEFGANNTLIVTTGDSPSELQFRVTDDQTQDDLIDSSGFTSYPVQCTNIDFHDPSQRITCPGNTNLQLHMGAGANSVTFNHSTNPSCFLGYDIDLGGGANILRLPDSCTAAAAPFTVTSGSGADTLYGGTQGSVTWSSGDGSDTWNGSAGDDIVHGGGGDDRLYGLDGNDQLFGDGGSDALKGDGGNDLIDGGDGDDNLGYCRTCPLGSNDKGPGADTWVGGSGADKLWFDDHVGAMNITIDGAANDGAAGENDNVGADIESITGSPGADVFTGSAGRDVFSGYLGNDEIHGGGGDDDLFGSDGDDKVFGDAGADRVQGSEGADTVDGGAGVDSIYGDVANCDVFCQSDADKLFARDGEQDSVDCGTGADTAQVDTQDVVAFCSVVDRPAAGPPPGTGTTPGTTPGTTTGTAFSFATTGTLTRARGVRIKITCPAACSFTATLVLGASTARKVGLGRRAVTIGSVRGSLLAAGTKTVTLKLTKKARTRLRKRGNVTATLKLAVKDAAGTTTRKQKTVTLRR